MGGGIVPGAADSSPQSGTQHRGPDGRSRVLTSWGGENWDATATRRSPRGKSFPMYLALSIGFTMVMAAAGPAIRLALVPVIAILFAMAFADRPKGGLAWLFFLTSLPIYIQFQDRDSMVLSTALILVAYVVATAKHILRPVPYVGWPALALVPVYALGTLGVLGTAVAGSSIRMLLGVITAVMLGHLVFSIVRTRATLLFMLRVLAAMLILQAVVCLIQSAAPGVDLPFLSAFASRGGGLGAIVTGGFGRATGTVGDYELLSEWFAAALPAFLCLTALERSYRWLWASALIACFVGALLTVSRAGAIAGALGLLVFLVPVILNGRAYAMRALFVGVLVPAATLLSVAFVAPQTVSSLVSRFGLIQTRVTSAASIPLTLNRNWLNLPADALRATIFGHGIYRLDVPGIAAWGSPHSLPLALWYQVGVVGCLAFAWIIAGYFAFCVKALRTRGASPVIEVLSSAMGAGLVASLASELVVEMVRYAHTIQYFAAIMALGLATFAISRAEARSA